MKMIAYPQQENCFEELSLVMGQLLAAASSEVFIWEALVKEDVEGDEVQAAAGRGKEQW
jgi:hypothetical protein